MVQALSRRDRVRAATTEEIKQTARRHPGRRRARRRVAARDRARDGHDRARALPLLRQPRGPGQARHRRHLHRAHRATCRPPSTPAGAASGGDLTAMVIAAAWEFRRWSLTHEREFGLLFGTPLPGVNIEQDEITAECGGQFGNTFFVLILELWRKHPFPVPADDEIDPGLREQLERYREGLGELAAGPAARPAADLPALLGAAVRDREPGGVRPPGLRAGRRRADVRADARGDRAAARPGLPAALAVRSRLSRTGARTAPRTPPAARPTTSAWPGPGAAAARPWPPGPRPGCRTAACRRRSAR